MSELTAGNGEVEHYYGMSNQYQLSFFFSLFLMLLMTSIVASNYVAHHLHWHFLPEAGATILVGAIGGVLCFVYNNAITHSLMIFDPNTFFIALLPPIIFNSGYIMKRRYFFDNIVPIVAYAVCGTTISSITVGLIMYGMGQAAVSLKLSLAEALSFGALISATDTVSVLAIFQELRVDPSLFYLVFGESSLNDAVAIVLFGTFSKFIGNVYESSYLPIAVLTFVLIFAGSTLIGILFGALSALLFKHFDFKGCLYHEVRCPPALGIYPSVQMGVYIMFSYLPFLAACICDLSGVVAVLFAGITMKHYTSNNLSDDGKKVCGHMFNAISYVAETTIFLNLGLAVFALQVGYHVKFILWSLIACLVGRAMFVFPLSYLINRYRPEERRVPQNQQVMIWFSGFRGALCFALALDWPNEKRSEIIATTMVVVLTTLFVGGGSTVPMLRWLKIKQLTPEEEVAMDSMVQPVARMPILQFDAKYWVPFFTHLHPDTSDFEYTTPIDGASRLRSDASAVAAEDEDTSKQSLRPGYGDEDEGEFSTISVDSSS
ncbi:Monovalent Cation:Proton Antiporter-1 (CPA1) Family [Achlya hypogyna]|uniref:Sodium/hydrogen exchanger n=1 Tax=Achlya hypogyna TaxID=1202772 RepID=A0A1V9ZEA1_ACHHY|nr:Monovalent Cation:Proton Antiporter-1 (CPA1) Family [Achlya hypogyna]